VSSTLTSQAVSPAEQLIEHMASSLTSPAWRVALNRLGAGTACLHLAIVAEPFYSWLMDGTKTIEARFSRVRCAPYGNLAEGDIIAVKQSGGMVTAAFLAGHVRSYQLTPQRISQLRDKYADQICASDDLFWQQREDCAYATLTDVTHIQPLPGLAFPKKDRRGWVQLTRPSVQQAVP
jgi:hypothetical protein